MVKSFQNVNPLFWTTLNDIGIIKYLKTVINRAFFSLLTSHCPFLGTLKIRPLIPTNISRKLSRRYFGDEC